MAYVKLRFDGMSELRAALRNMPAELTGEASHIVEGIANGVASRARQVYPYGPTGNLIGGVRVTHFEGGKVTAGAVVKSSARHAHLYEWGTKKPRKGRGGYGKGEGSRSNGKLANRGRMPEAPEARAFIPIVVNARRRMFEQLEDLLRRNGLIVGGGPPRAA